ncbi:MAG: hypothetical protein AB2417_05275 [Clostridiaceae bacterium]
MILKPNVSIAFKGNNGKYVILNTSLFQFSQCVHVFDVVEKAETDGGILDISIICPICGDNHKYNFSYRKLINKGVSIGGCEKFGTPVLYIGNEKKIQDKILKYNNFHRDIYRFLSSDS